MRRLFAVLVVIAAIAAGCGDDAPKELTGIQRTPFPDVGSTSLPDVSEGGRQMPFVADDEGLLLVYFGYTHCPDVCPTTLSDVRSALRKLDEGDSARIRLAMATVDPGRDVDEIVTGYVQSFLPGSAALRTTDEGELRAAADAFGVTYDVSTNEEGEVEVIHTGFLYVVDDQGRLLLTWPFGIPADDIANDLQILLSETTA